MKPKETTKKPKVNKPKADELTADARVLEIVKQMVRGARRYDIMQYVTDEAKWGVNERQIDNYIAKAKIKLKEVSKEKLDIEEEFGLAIYQLSDLYKKAYEAKEYNVARMIRRDLSSLTGIDKFEVKIVTTGDMAQEEIIKELKALGLIAQKEKGTEI